MANQLPYDATMMPTELERNISEVDRRIRAAEQAAGRAAGTVSLLAVSKTKPSELVRQAHRFGLSAFGENYAQEMAEKAAALADLALSWHFIGPIQSNKTALIAEVSDWVHSIDRLKVARRLSEQRPDGKAPLNVLVQINTSNEDSKSGVRSDAAPELLAAINELPGLRLRGLMTIPAATTNQTAQREPFRQLSELMARLSDSLPQLDTLSMGMSGDLEAAVSEGANIVRVGTDIFGARYN
jgi:pyridoxal phosphate enzyme (YggS family)